MNRLRIVLFTLIILCAAAVVSETYRLAHWVSIVALEQALSIEPFLYRLLNLIDVLVCFWVAAELYRRLLNLVCLKNNDCPRCGKVIGRIHRRPIEHLLSFVLPGLQRYACSDPLCGWTSLRRNPGTAKQNAHTSIPQAK
jgi:hypothetical protein